MPELPDISIYIEALEARLEQATLQQITVSNPFLLRTVTPSIDQFTNAKLLRISRIGKRIAFQFEPDLWIVIHLMIAGRLQWLDATDKKPSRKSLAKFSFSAGTLLLTEAGSKRRASLHLFSRQADVELLNRGGLEIFEINNKQFSARLTRRNHTLKRALTDQSLFSGIGNAYSDEILHHAGLSPIRQTQKMPETEIQTLFTSCRYVLAYWLDVLRAEHLKKFPAKVTAFKDGMSVHGRYQKPCPVCATKIQRIRYASNETNYCPRCQTDGKLLADRSLSRLLKKDWPKTIEALEEADTKGSS